MLLLLYVDVFCEFARYRFNVNDNQLWIKTEKKKYIYIFLPFCFLSRFLVGVVDVIHILYVSLSYWRCVLIQHIIYLYMETKHICDTRSIIFWSMTILFGGCLDTCISMSWNYAIVIIYVEGIPPNSIFELSLQPALTIVLWNFN